MTDSDGNHPALISLNLEFDPVKVAVFDSGEFLLLGLDHTRFEPVVAFLNRDGHFIRYLSVFSTANASGGVREQLTAKEQERLRSLSLGIGAVQFAPWGTDVVLVAPGVDNSSIYHIRPSGQVEKIRINLPDGQLVENILGSGGRDSWVIRADSAEAAKKMAESHIVENPQEFLYEVSQRTGELLRRLDVSGPFPREVVCAADGKLAAIYPGEPQQPDGPDRLVFASTGR